MPSTPRCVVRGASIVNCTSRYPPCPRVDASCRYTLTSGTYHINIPKKSSCMHANSFEFVECCPSFEFQRLPECQIHHPSVIISIHILTVLCIFLSLLPIIHHRTPSLSSDTLDALASRTAGYCGADLRALCSEAALRAVRRRYPQIYQAEQKLLIDVNRYSCGMIISDCSPHVAWK